MDSCFTKQYGKTYFTDIGELVIKPENTIDNQAIFEGIPKIAKMIYISYGVQNGKQAYGGSTVIINIFEYKPCFLPIYRDTDIIGTIYIYVNPVNEKIITYGMNLTQNILLKIGVR